MKSVSDYLKDLEEVDREAMATLLNIFRSHLPKGFEETIQYNMPSFVVPLSLYPKGYLGDAKKPLGFVGICVKKSGISLHHLGLYGSAELSAWFKEAWTEQVPTRLDMGKGCVRFKRPYRIPTQLLAQLAGRMTPQEWMTCVDATFGKEKH